MKFLKYPLVVLILFFGNNLFSQKTLKGSIPENPENLGIDLYLFSADFYVGYKEVRRKDFKKIIKNNPVAYQAYLTGVNLRTFGNILAVGSVVVLGTVYIPTAYGAAERWIFPTSLTTLLIGGIMYTIGRAKLRKSVDIYNQVDDLGFKIGVTENGLGVVLNF